MCARRQLKPFVLMLKNYVALKAGNHNNFYKNAIDFNISEMKNIAVALQTRKNTGLTLSGKNKRRFRRLTVFYLLKRLFRFIK